MARTGAFDEMAPDADARQQRPYVGIGLGLLALIFVLVVGAFLLNRQLRPQVGLDPAGAAAARGAGQLPSRTISGESEIGLLATPLQKDIATAYLRYWAVYGSAMETLDTSRLSEVAAAGRLQEAIEEVEELKAEGVAAKVQIKHSFSVTSATETEASIRGEYINSSYAVDPVSRRPVGEPGQSQHSVHTYHLKRIDGAWKVVGGTRGAA